MLSWKFKENKQKNETTETEFYNEISSYLLSEWLPDVSLWPLAGSAGSRAGTGPYQAGWPLNRKVVTACGCLGGASWQGILLKPNTPVGNLHFSKETLNNQNQNVSIILM